MPPWIPRSSIVLCLRFRDSAQYLHCYLLAVIPIAAKWCSAHSELDVALSICSSSCEVEANHPAIMLRRESPEFLVNVCVIRVVFRAHPLLRYLILELGDGLRWECGGTYDEYQARRMGRQSSWAGCQARLRLRLEALQYWRERRELGLVEWAWTLG